MAVEQRAIDGELTAEEASEHIPGLLEQLDVRPTEIDNVIYEVHLRNIDKRDRELAPLSPNTSRHDTLTAVRKANEHYGRPVRMSEVEEFASGDYSINTVHKRLTTLYDQKLLDREGESTKYQYKLSPAGKMELSYYGYYGE